MLETRKKDIRKKSDQIRRNLRTSNFVACLLMPEDEIRRFLDLELVEESKNGLKAIDIAKIMSFIITIMERYQRKH